MGSASQFTSYVTVLLSLVLAGVMAHGPVLMTVGGLLLLCLRLYVDGTKAWRTFRKEE